jgi:hypothetical protein
MYWKRKDVLMVQSEGTVIEMPDGAEQSLAQLREKTSMRYINF